MLIAKSRKSDRKNDRKGDKKLKEKARKQAALARRVLFSVLIAGVLGVFLYNNRDYFLDPGDSADVGPKLASHFAGKKAESAPKPKPAPKAKAEAKQAEGRPAADPKPDIDAGGGAGKPDHPAGQAAAEPKPKPGKPKKAKDVKVSGGTAREHRSVGEVLGGLEFSGNADGGVGKSLAALSEPPRERSPEPVAGPGPEPPPSTLAQPLKAAEPSAPVLQPPPKEPAQPPKRDSLLAQAPAERLVLPPLAPPEEPPQSMPPPGIGSLRAAGAQPDSASAAADSLGAGAEAAAADSALGAVAGAPGGGKGFFARLDWDRLKSWGMDKVNLGVERIKGFDPDKLNGLGVDQLKKIDAEQLERLGADRLKSIDPEKLKSAGAGLFAHWKAEARAHWEGAGLWLRSWWDRAGLNEFWESVNSLVLLGMDKWGGGGGDKRAASGAGGADAVQRADAVAAPVDTAAVKRSGSLLLPDISCNLGDREDLRINMSIELLFDGSDSLAGELDFKRGMLLAVAGAVMRKNEYGNISLTALSAGLLNSFNGQLRSGQLSGVDIKEFQVEQVASRYWDM
ncbi:MAG: hypothetical protein LBH93_05300 [Chitinispirillales bacterium]|jgi:hypothetical protein|nr:hypothetical protein [Chitinispirillales bacterium]